MSSGVLSPRLIGILEYYHPCFVWRAGPEKGVDRWTETGVKWGFLSGLVITWKLTECQLPIDQAGMEPRHEPLYPYMWIWSIYSCLPEMSSPRLDLFARYFTITWLLLCLMANLIFGTSLSFGSPPLVLFSLQGYEGSVGYVKTSVV